MTGAPGLPFGAWARATYMPRDTSVLSEDQRRCVGQRGVYRGSDVFSALVCPASYGSFKTVNVADLIDLELIGRDAGMVEWHADLQAAAARASGSRVP